MLVPRRIERPPWARLPQLDRSEITKAEYNTVVTRREALLEAVHAELVAYLADPSLVFDDSSCFPVAQHLSGEYYVSDESYYPGTGGNRLEISVRAHLLETADRARGEDRDYLALEVWLSFDDDGQFRVFRNTDSSSI